MNVVRAEYAGACYGVQRALDMALQTVADGKQASTLGPLIHNPQVVEQLAQSGVHAVDDPTQIDQGAVIIRSHGVAPAVRRAVLDRGLEVIDATCPHVARAQNAAAELARSLGYVIVVGEVGHPEVEGLVAYAREEGGTVVVAATPDDLPDEMPLSVGVVVQTTQTREAFDAIVEALRERGREPVVKDTVCFATRQRQNAAAELASNVDAMVVIGGRNSSNTTRLADICATTCARTYHIETPDELDPGWFDNCETVGVSAGASTPESQIAGVIARLETF